jgi:DNA-directed RNA polymerase subunit RPC12/RpoP
MDNNKSNVALGVECPLCGEQNKIEMKYEGQNPLASMLKKGMKSYDFSSAIDCVCKHCGAHILVTLTVSGYKGV